MQVRVVSFGIANGEKQVPRNSGSG